MLFCDSYCFILSCIVQLRFDNCCIRKIWMILIESNVLVAHCPPTLKTLQNHCIRRPRKLHPKSRHGVDRTNVADTIWPFYFFSKMATDRHLGLMWPEVVRFDPPTRKRCPRTKQAVDRTIGCWDIFNYTCVLVFILSFYCISFIV